MQESGDLVFESEQWVPQKREVVFDFFSRAENLEELTPSWLNFHILNTSTPRIEKGTLIHYRLKLYGVPIIWRTLIEEWKPNQLFIDTQLKGPYAKWHHTHRFEEKDGGTLIRDRVVYRLPGGRLGKWVGGAWVSRDVRRIFEFRKEAIAMRMGQ